jgi:hypothetical protein
VGTLGPSQRLFVIGDGGASLALVEDLAAQAPPAICGLSVVNELVAYGSGTNFPTGRRA